MKTESKDVILALSAGDAGNEIYIEIPRTKSYLFLSKDELYELWNSLNLVYGEEIE